MKELWVEKYRPSSIGQYVFRDEKQILSNYTQFLSKLSGSFSTMTSASAENAETLSPHRLGEIGL